MAWQSHVRQAEFSRRSFEWVALSAVVKAILKIKDGRASVTGDSGHEKEIGDSFYFSLRNAI